MKPTEQEALSPFSFLLDAYEARVSDHALRVGPYAEGAAFVRGEFVPAAEATVPLFDYGFLRSDLTYDVPAVWNGRFFRLDDHLARLERSCAKLRLEPPMSTPRIREMLIELVRLTQLRDAYVDVIVTRGAAPKGQRDVRLAAPAIYAFVVPYIWILPLVIHEVGGSAIVTRDVKRTPPGSMDPTIKNLQWGDLSRGFFEAFDRGANLPLLPDGDGNITEGCYNIFTVHDHVLRTPLRGVLEGVTRLTAMQIARAEGWAVRMEDVHVGSLYDADEIFLSSTAGGIMPITTLDNHRVGSGKVGPITRRIWERYWELHGDPDLSFAIDYG
jgi:branched-subunit amino acid aminotransferase/4-amino-4-deoxychorismate lyase